MQADAVPQSKSRKPLGGLERLTQGDGVSEIWFMVIALKGREARTWDCI
jgi:hypothetical protein